MTETNKHWDNNQVIYITHVKTVQLLQVLFAAVEHVMNT